MSGHNFITRERSSIASARLGGMRGLSKNADTTDQSGRRNTDGEKSVFGCTIY